MDSGPAIQKLFESGEMMALEASEVRAALGADMIGGKQGIQFTGISTDSRCIRPGDLFFALVGENFDGHDFVLNAFSKGAAGAVISRCDWPIAQAERDVAIFRVADTRTALGDLAAFYRSRFSIPVIGVTGSVGKTTTKEMIAAVLSRRFQTLKNDLNFNNEIGVPLTLFQLDEKHEAAVIEMAMRLPGEIARLAEIAKPTIGVITNIGMSHIERLGSLEAIAAAKAELLRALPDCGLAVLPADDDFFGFLRRICHCSVVSYGLSGGSDVQGHNIDLDAEGRPRADISIKDGTCFRIRLPILGLHNVRNALAATAVGWHFGIPLDEVKAALEQFDPPEKRANLIRSPRGFIVFDDSYNASPASMAAALHTLSKMRAQRKIAVLGDMLELGEYAATEHKEIGRLAGRSGISLLITVGELARWISEGAKESGMESIESAQTSDEAAELISDVLRPGDLVLVKGSHAMRMETIVARLLSA